MLIPHRRVSSSPGLCVRASSSLCREADGPPRQRGAVPMRSPHWRLTIERNENHVNATATKCCATAVQVKGRNEARAQDCAGGERHQRGRADTRLPRPRYASPGGPRRRDGLGRGATDGVTSSGQSQTSCSFSCSSPRFKGCGSLARLASTCTGAPTAKPQISEPGTEKR